MDSDLEKIKRQEYLYDEVEMAYQNRKFIIFRWLAIVFFLMLSIFSAKVFHFVVEENLPYLLGTIAVLGVINLLLSMSLRKFPQNAYAVLRFQIYSDLVFLTVFMHFSGGIENPMILLTSLFVMISGMLLSRRDCYTVAASALALMILLGCAEWSEFLPHHSLLLVPHGAKHDKVLWKPLFMVTQLGLHGLFLFLTAFLSTTLAERARMHKSSLKSMAEVAMEERMLLVQSLVTTRTGLRVMDRNLTLLWQNALWDQWFTRSDAHRVPGSSSKPMEDMWRDLELAAEDTFKDGKTRSQEFEFQKISGGSGKPVPPVSGIQNQTIRVTIASLKDSDEEIHQVVFLAQDVSEQKKNQRRILASGKLAAIGEMAGKIAHEVNNPVSIISGKARILLSDRSDEMSEKVVSELSKITQLADRITRITRNLLSYSRPKRTSRHPVNVRIPLLVSLESIKQPAAARDIEIVKTLEGDFPPVLADSNELEQVFLNIFLNAMDAVDDGGKLMVSVKKTPDNPIPGKPVLEVRISDNGKGIPEEILESIFDPFFTTKDTGGNTGLGLSICREIVYNTGGTISVKSKVGSGTMFKIQLPVTG